MPRLHLTDLGIKALKPTTKQVDYFCTTQKGFGVRISPAGTKTFFLLTGTPKRRHTLGHYGQGQGLVSLGDARKAAHNLKHASVTTVAPTLVTDALLTYYTIAIIPNYRPRPAAEAQRILTKHTATFPKYVTDITTRHCTTIIDTLVATPSEANHFFSALKTFFNWCEQRQLISRSPLASLSKPAKEVSRDRTLSDEELQNVWNATTSFSQFNTIVRLCILTGQRRGELARIEPSWITQTTLTIPASVSKNNSEHTIPLTPFTLDLITTTPLGSYNSWSQPKAKLDRRSGVTGWTLHDLRRTFSTIHAQIGTPPHITERLLNHLTGTLSPIARIYNRHTFADEMRSALIAYENHLRTILVFPPEHLAPISA